MYSPAVHLFIAFAVIFRVGSVVTASFYFVLQLGLDLLNDMRVVLHWRGKKKVSFTKTRESRPTALQYTSSLLSLSVSMSARASSGKLFLSGA